MIYFGGLGAVVICSRPTFNDVIVDVNDKTLRELP